MKSITVLVLSILTSMLVTAAVVYPYRQQLPIAPAPKPEPISVDTQFVRLCSGLDIAGEQTTLIASANCLGRIRGYADSHVQTIRMMQLRFAMPYNVQLWCIPRDITDKTLMSDVTTWITKNKDDYTLLTSKFIGTSGAMGVAAAALHSTYPCATTP